MKINNNLILAAGFNPTRKTHQLDIFEMCKQIKENSIVLPLYQRDLSWNLKKAVSLLNYQLLGKAPVSPISINVIDDIQKVPQVSFIDREVIDSVVKGQYSVVDGQQRLSTNYKAYTNHEDFRNIVLDISRGKFILVEGAIRNTQIPVGVLLNERDELLSSYIESSPILGGFNSSMLLTQVRTKMKNYNYTINFADGLSEDEQIEWFEVLNNAGSRVSILQMRFSKLKSHGIDIYTDYTHKYQNKLEEFGFSDIFSPYTTGVSYPIAMLNPAYEVVTKRKHNSNFAPIPSDTKENQICALGAHDLNTCFEITLDALDKTLNFITDHELTDPNRIDYINYLTGYFVFKSDELNEINLDYLIEWYNDIDFTNKSNSQRRQIFTDLILS